MGRLGLTRIFRVSYEASGRRRCSTLATARGLLASVAGRGSVSLRHHGDVAVVELNNPRSRNAISCSMMLQLDDIVRELEGWTTGRALVVVGFGGTFCSGADLGSQPALFTEQYGRAMSRVMTDATTRLRALPLVSVAAVAGAAVGGGAELTTACDYRVMMDDAFMQWVHVSRGVVPGWGGLHRLHSIVGRSHALFIAGSGKRLSAVQAASFGLADVVLPSTLPLEASEQGRSKNVDDSNGAVADDGVATDAVDRVLLHGALDFLSVSL